ncbi:MAG: hypothetical protein HUN05_14190 [Desulfobacter sp.]|nr:MAG: hypothetical protein HUN05_14190 [Desulfobacter sp.]
MADENTYLSIDLDDLSILVDTDSDKGLDTLLDEETALPPLDDLSHLIDQTPTEPNGQSDMDDLFSLVDNTTESSLSLDQEAADLDDLSLLANEPATNEKDTASHGMDDLSALVNDINPISNEEGKMDDLSQLLDAPSIPPKAPEPLGEDLWTLVEKKSETSQPSLKPDINPDQDVNKYKAAVMKIIIELKSNGLSPKEATDRLNKDEVATLSGKPQWGENAIKKIYGFIDSAQ